MIGPATVALWLDPMASDDRAFVRRSLATAFGFTEARADEYVDNVGTGSVLVARVRDVPVGVAALIASAHVFEGAPVPAANIAHVALAPERRGRGLAVPLVEALVARAARDSAAMVSLFASTRPVYRRCGFELAGHEIRYEADTSALPARDDGEFEEIDPLDPGIRHAYEVKAAGEAGHLVRSPAHWAELLAAPRHALAAYRCGEHAYVILDASDPGCLNVRDWAASSPGSARRILGFLGQFRSVYPRVRWHGGPSDDLVAALPDKGWRVAYQEEWLARVLDPVRALEARTYLTKQGSCAFALDGPAGTSSGLHLSIDDGAASCAAINPEQAAVRLSAPCFASLYTGHRTASRLARAGLLSGDAVAVRTLDRMFAGSSPWVAEHF